MSTTLGTALLWLNHSEHGDGLPNIIRQINYLSNTYFKNSNFQETNPLKRLPIIITRNLGQILWME